MFIDKIINWFDNKDDVTADMARSNNKWYEFQLEIERKNYIESLCKQIKTASRSGAKCIWTLDTHDKKMTYEFMMEIKEYFEQRGFTVKEEGNRTGALVSWLRISWG